ncbi:MAG: hypothetical protein IJ057_07770 [Bacteroidales bacterium]|nr:hypothetical protein [Bacteroidales bacterium]
MSDDKFQNKYRIPSARASWHDYNGGTYYVTICTHKHVEYFGRITMGENGEPKMNLSKIGKIADECVVKMETLHDDISVPLWVVMPNHIHLIVIVKPPIVETPYYDVSINESTDLLTPYHDVSTDEPTGSRAEWKNEKMQEIANDCGRLSHVISRFKTAVTKYAHENNIPFAWQTRFHDHIVRNVDELNGISAYIENNIAKWAYDELNEKRRDATL